MAISLEDITVKVKAIKSRNPVYAELAQWVGELLSTTVKASENFRPSDMKLDFDSLPKAWYQGKSFLNPVELSLDWEQAKDLYEQLVDRIKTMEDGRRQVEGLLKALAKDHEGIPILMKAALTSDFEAIQTAAQKFKVDPPVLTLLLRLSLRPALLETAQAVQSLLDLNQWTYGHCPVCGSAPKLADLSGEGGKRSLHCSLCETVWTYPRLQCPFCENDNRKDLSYLRAENEEGLRVDLCSRCGHYLKTIDLRELPGPVIVPLDDVATWHLDLVAQKNIEDPDTTKPRVT
jgi:FdhE protein